MKFNITGVLVVIFLLLGGYVYFFERNSLKKDEAVPEPVEKAIDLNTEDVREILLGNHEKDILLKRVGEQQWKIEQSGALVDHKKVESLLTIFNMGIVMVIDPNPSDLSLYGLHKPRYSLGIKIAGEDTFHTLIIGDDSPGSLSSYGKVKDQSRVILLGVRYRQEFDRFLKVFSQAVS